MGHFRGDCLRIDCFVIDIYLCYDKYKVRSINPAKSEILKISKYFLEQVRSEIYYR